MRVYTVADLRTLAIAYCGAKRISPRSLGLRMGLNNRIFARIVEEGQGCRAESAEAASKWFDENWPADVRWPLNAAAKGNPRLDHPSKTLASEPVP